MKLYILINDGGDGSYYPKFVLDPGVIVALEQLYDDGIMDYENGYGVDGGGFHYTTIDVPDDSTPFSLGLGPYQVINLEDVREQFKPINEEEGEEG